MRRHCRRRRRRGTVQGRGSAYHALAECILGLLFYQTPGRLEDVVACAGKFQSARLLALAPARQGFPARRRHDGQHCKHQCGNLVAGAHAQGARGTRHPELLSGLLAWRPVQERRQLHGPVRQLQGVVSGKETDVAPGGRGLWRNAFCCRSTSGTGLLQARRFGRHSRSRIPHRWAGAEGARRQAGRWLHGGAGAAQGRRRAGRCGAPDGTEQQCALPDRRHGRGRSVCGQPA